MIIVTGATGHYGRRVVEGLSTKLPATKMELVSAIRRKRRICCQRGPFPTYLLS